MDLPQPAGPGDSGVGHVVLQPAPDPFHRVVVRAVPRAVQHLHLRVPAQVAGHRAGVVDAVVVTDHHDLRGEWERLGEHPQESHEVSGAAAAQPVHPAPRGHLDGPVHRDLPVLPWRENLRPGPPRRVQLARTCGSQFRCVSSWAHTTAWRGSSISRATIPATT